MVQIFGTKTLFTVRFKSFYINEYLWHLALPCFFYFHKSETCDAISVFHTDFLKVNKRCSRGSYFTWVFIFSYGVKQLMFASCRNVSAIYFTMSAQTSLSFKLTYASLKCLSKCYFIYLGVFVKIFLNVLTIS